MLSKVNKSINEGINMLLRVLRGARGVKQEFKNANG